MSSKDDNGPVILFLVILLCVILNYAWDASYPNYHKTIIGNLGDTPVAAGALTLGVVILVVRNIIAGRTKRSKSA